MNLSPREKDKLLISMAAMVARNRHARGVKLNHPEAVALISDFVVEGRARWPVRGRPDGRGRACHHPRGLHGGDSRDDPLRSGRSDLSRRHQACDRSPPHSLTGAPMIPGEVFPAPGTLTLNDGAERDHLTVANTGDRPIRWAAITILPKPTPVCSSTAAPPRGYRLDIAAGTAVRFEPGQTRDVQLGALPGRPQGVRVQPENNGGAVMPASIDRSTYADMFGPTTGDKVRLADTDLVIEVERDLTTYGEEVKFGGGKVIRDGMGQSQRSRAEGDGGHGHHQRADRGPYRHLQGRCGPARRADRGHRQGRQPRHATGRDHRHRAGDRGHRGRGQDPDRRRVRRAYPFHLPAADRGCAGIRHYHHAGWRHRPRAWHAGHHLHAGAVAYWPHAAGVRGVSR